MISCQDDYLKVKANVDKEVLPHKDWTFNVR